MYFSLSLFFKPFVYSINPLCVTVWDTFTVTQAALLQQQAAGAPPQILFLS